MKHLSFFLVLLCLALRPGAATAQVVGPDSLSRQLAGVFANLDKSQVPTGYLYEAGIRFLEPRYYNGTLSDSNRTSIDILRYLRGQLRSARVFGVDTLPAPPAFNARLDAASAAAGSAIPLALMYQPYASIRPEALQNNLLRAQGQQLFDVPGRAQSPYQTNVLFAAAPALDYARTNTVAFVFRRNLYLSSTGALPGGLFLDFGDGRGYLPAAWDVPLAATYPTAGTKRVKVKIVFGGLPVPVGTQAARATAEVRESWFDFQVLAVAAVARYDASYGLAPQ